MRPLAVLIMVLSMLLLTACPTLPGPRPDVEKVRKDHEDADRDLDKEGTRRRDSND